MLGGQCRTCSFVFLHCSEIGGLKYKRERAKSPTLFKQYNSMNTLNLKLKALEPQSHCFITNPMFWSAETVQ